MTTAEHMCDYKRRFSEIVDALTIHRLYFAFTLTFHYIFPQLTMGLALLLVC